MAYPPTHPLRDALLSPFRRLWAGLTPPSQWPLSATGEERRELMRQAWRSFFLSTFLLGIAFLLAVYSGVLAQDGDVLGTFLAATTALGISLIVGITWVPQLARRSSMEWLRVTIDYHLTRAGKVFIGAIFVVAIAALNTGNNMLFLILAALLASILVSGVVSRIVLTRLQGEVLLPDHVFAEQPVLARVVLRNRKQFLPTFSVTAGGPLPETRTGRKRRQKLNGVVAPTAVLPQGVYFPYLRAGAESSQAVEVVFPKRGMVREDALPLSSAFPFGFLLKVRRIPSHREIVVYPPVTPTEEFYEILPMISGEVESYLRGRGHDLYSIRDYLFSDSARFVDWKASARTSGMKVREFAREDERRLQMIFDNYLPERSPASLATFEKAVNFCAALAWHFEQIDAQIQFTAPGVATEMAAGHEVLHEVLRFLATVEPSARPFDWNSLASGTEGDAAFKIILTAAGRGSIPTNLWGSSYFVFHQDL